MMTIVIDYEAGNLRSVETALRFLQTDFAVTADPTVVAAADRVILPGVGDAGAAMTTLRERGMPEALGTALSRGVPVLGICLGSQIILERSEEAEGSCLGFIPGEAVRFQCDLKVPHMGWNTIQVERDHPLFQGLQQGSSFYFVHSYYPRPAQPLHCLGTCEYGQTFAAVVGRDNLVATQFHPEKSGEAGLRMLRAFLDWRP